MGLGGDNGVGFHSTQPVRLERHDDTENVHNRDKLKQSDGDITADGQVANYPKWPQSPYVRYVSRPLSDGSLSTGLQSYTPKIVARWVDRSIPFGFGTICGQWKMKLIYSWMLVPTGWRRVWQHIQSRAHKRIVKRTSIMNSSHSIPTKTSDGGRNCCGPLAPIAGQVTSAVATGVNAGDLKMEDANPAKVRKEDEGVPRKKQTLMRNGSEVMRLQRARKGQIKSLRLPRAQLPLLLPQRNPRRVVVGKKVIMSP